MWALKDRPCNDRHQRRARLAGSPICFACSSDVLTLYSTRFLWKEGLRTDKCTKYSFPGKLDIQEGLSWRSRPERTSVLADVCWWCCGPTLHIYNDSRHLLTGGDALRVATSYHGSHLWDNWCYEKYPPLPPLPLLQEQNCQNIYYHQESAFWVGQNHVLN